MTTVSILAFAPDASLQGISLHPAVPLAFCAFLAFQLCLYFCCWRALSRQRKILTRLCQEERAPDQLATDGTARNDWLGWISTRLRDGAFHDGHYNRDDALEQLDRWLEGLESYLMLQRTGIVAPMVGLLITVAGFLSLDPSAGDWNLKEILQMVSPIVLGIGSGAALTTFNHLLLHFVGKKTDVVRSLAGNWFDERIWKGVQTKPQTSGNEAAEALAAMAETIRRSLTEYCNATSAISHTSQSLQGAGAALAATVERLREDTAAIPEEMKSLRSTASGVVRSLGEIVPNIERTTSELAESVVAFRSVVQEQFGKAAARHRESAELLAGSVDGIRESAAHLSEHCDSLGRSIEAHGRTSQEWSRSLQEEILPAQHDFRQASTQLIDATKELAPAERAFREAADSMRGSANGLAAFVRDGVDPASRRLAELNKVLSRMQETTESVRQMTELREEFVCLAKSLAQAATAADAIRTLPQEIRAVVQSLVPSRNGSSGPRHPFLLRLFGFGRRSNGKLHADSE